MDGFGTSREIVHGLRHRGTGLLVRVREQTVVLQDEPFRTVDTTYHMTLDAGHPVFDAGSPGTLARALLSRSGGSPRQPNPDGLTARDVEPVLFETVVTRTLAPLALDMEESTLVERGAAYDLDHRLGRSIPDLRPFLEALRDHAGELSKGREPGGEHDLGRARLVAIVIHAPTRDLDELPGRLVTQGQGMHRRAVGAVDLPESMAHLALVPRGQSFSSARVLVCLDDARPVTEAYLDQVAPRSGAPAP